MQVLQANEVGDFRVEGGDFNSTRATVEAISARGLEYLSQVLGAGAVSFETRKSAGLEFAAKVEALGYIVLG